MLSKTAHAHGLHQKNAAFVGHAQLAVVRRPVPQSQSQQQQQQQQQQCDGVAATLGLRNARLPHAASVAAAPLCAEELKAREYNKTMHTQMQWGLNPYEYHPQRGLYWHEIVPGLICGTQPRSAADVATLAQGGVAHIINLQTDKDMQHWSVNIDELQRSCSFHRVNLIRRSARDFDPLSLRKTLPAAVSAVRHALAERRGKVYVHCTAGLGRAPAVCIAYMYWFLDMELDQAYKTLTDIRPCGPKRDAIRGATFDLLSGAPSDQFEHLNQDAWASLCKEDKFALQWRVLKNGG